jgi:NAD(P)-dependent dehydrogenase (short-subunit alcohol dehydrogenase family)
MRLDGKRLLVVGASQGIGLAIARGASRQGASVALAARSIDRLESLAKQLDRPAISIECDVRQASSCRMAVEVACETFGGLDGVVYSAGITRLTELADASYQDWSEVLQTNLVGAALTTKFAMAPLSQSSGTMIYLSSSTTSLEPPWRGNALYTTSKVALNHMARCWQIENPAVDFTVLVVGPTGGTEFLREVPGDVRRRFVGEWLSKQSPQAVLDPDDVAAVLTDVLTCPGHVESVTVTASQGRSR